MTGSSEVTLIINGPNIKETSNTLKAGRYVIGREEDCELIFPTTFNTISRHHACLVISEKSITIEDLNSSGGVMVNGNFIYKHDLKNDDLITIGPISIRIKLPQDHKTVKNQFALTQEVNVEEDAIQLSEDLQHLKMVSEQVLGEVGKRIVGQEDILAAIWTTILAKGHCLLIGVPGLAKTYMVNTFSKVIGMQFNRVQFTPDLMPTDIIGSNVIQEDENGKRHFEFDQGPIFTQLLLADEINRTPPKTQAALLEAMQEGQITVGKRSLNLPQPFCVIATQNPIDQEGTYPLPEAQQDRFLVSVVLDYPDRTNEVDILLQTSYGTAPAIQQLITFQQIMNFQRLVNTISISREMAEYAADIVRATRPATSDIDFVKTMIDYGAGPRAGQAILRSAKAYAAIDGRPAIGKADIDRSLLTCLRHRICCNYKAKAQGHDEDSIINMIREELNK